MLAAMPCLSVFLLRSCGVAVERATMRDRRFHSQRTPCEFFAVHCPQRDCGVVLSLHFDKAESARAPVEPVAHDLSPIYTAYLGKGLAQISIAQRKTQIANE
jgi:hypothetical protein